MGLLSQDTLNYRTQIMQSAQDASKAAITKRRNVERMKGSTSISAQKVDEALEDLQEVRRLPLKPSARFADPVNGCFSGPRRRSESHTQSCRHFCSSTHRASNPLATSPRRRGLGAT